MTIPPHPQEPLRRLSSAAVLASIFLVTMLGLAALSYWHEWRVEQDKTQSLARALSTAAAEQIGGSLRTIDLLIQHVGQFVLANGELDMLVISASLDIQSRAFPEMDALIIADEQGMAHGEQGGLGQDVSSRDFFTLQRRLFRDNRVVVDGPLRNGTTGEWQVILSRPLVGWDGRFRGVVAAALKSSFFVDPLKSTGTERLGTVTLVNVNRVVFGRFPDGDKWVGSRLTPEAIPARLEPTDPAEILRTGGAIDGLDEIAAFRAIPNYPLVVIAAFPVETVRNAWWRNTLRAAAIVGAIGVVMIYLALLFDREDRKRRHAARDLAVLNRDLEIRVFERTQSLSAEIAERSRAEAQTERMKEAYRGLFDGAIEGILIYRDFKPLLANQSCARLFGYASAEAMQTLPSILELVSPAARQDVTRASTEAAASQHLTTIEFEAIARDGGTFWCLNSIRPVTWKGGEAMQAAFVDITASKCWEAKMREEKEAAETANSLKSRFLAVASHDLRQPVQALAFYVNVLAKRIQGEEPEGILRRIAASTESLSGLLDSLLDMSKLEAGVVRPAVQPVPLGPMLERLWALNCPAAEQAGVSLSVVASKYGVRSDPILLERVLQNLITNAVRYTAAGGKVLVGCRPRGDRVAVQVLDTGRGIAQDALPRVFEEFFRVGESAVGRRGGLGLGLSIVQRLCELMGHRLSVRSRVGRGSVFEVELAGGNINERPQAALVPRPQVSLGDGWTVMVIDNDSQLLDSLRLQLEDWGLRALPVASAEQALAAMRAAGAPDLVLADYHLDAGETGTAITAMLEAELGYSLRLILLTAETAPAMTQNSDLSGPHLLHKPVSPDDLRAALAEMLGQVEKSERAEAI